MVLHNPNNWHWVNKDVSGWAREYLQQKLVGVSAEKTGVHARVNKLVNMDGDVDVSQRKGKVITLFDVQVTLEYEGKTSEGEDVTGSIKIPEVAHDTEENEFVFDVDIYSETSSKQPVKDLVRADILPQLRALLVRLRPDMIAEHGSDLQHTSAENLSKTSSSQSQSEAKKVLSTPVTTTSTTSTSSGASKKTALNTTTVSVKDEFRTTAEEAYKTFVDPQRIAAFTRGPLRVFEGSNVGCKFSIFDGNVNGEYTDLKEFTRIVQKWRLAQWAEGHYATLEIDFHQNDVHNVTVLNCTFKNVPVGQEEVVRRNWEMYYMRSIKQTFGLGTLL